MERVMIVIGLFEALMFYAH